MYYFPVNPPYFLMIAGLFVGVTSGLAFGEVLKQLVQAWGRDREGVKLTNLNTVGLKLPYTTMIFGIGAFLGAGLQVFGFPEWFAWAVSLPLTLLTAGLVWWQLSNLMLQIETQGLESLDIDGMMM